MPNLKSNFPDIIGSLCFTSWMMQSISPWVKFGRRTLAGGEEDILNNNEGGRRRQKGDNREIITSPTRGVCLQTHTADMRLVCDWLGHSVSGLVIGWRV